MNLTHTHTKSPSDHYPLIAEMKLRLEKREREEGSMSTTWKAVQKPYHVEEVVKRNEEKKNLHPSYPTALNFSLTKFSDDFYDAFTDLIQNTDQLFPKTKPMLDEKLELVNKALISAAESNLKPRENIDRTFIITDK